MQDNNIMISYKIQDVRIIKTKIIDGEYHIYGIRDNKKLGKDGNFTSVKLPSL